MKHKLPSVMDGFDTQLKLKEIHRVDRYSDSVQTILAHLAKPRAEQEREIQLFLYGEIMREKPRATVLHRLCASLNKVQGKQKRAELAEFLNLTGLRPNRMHLWKKNK